jgi:hypothetical protein
MDANELDRLRTIALREVFSAHEATLNSGKDGIRALDDYLVDEAQPAQLSQHIISALIDVRNALDLLGAYLKTDDLINTEAEVRVEKQL